MLAQNGILVLTLPASVKEDESKGRMALCTIGNPHFRIIKICSVALGLWSKSGSQRVLFSNHKILPDGLEGIIEGLERMGMGQVSRTKLVAHPQET